MQAAMTKKTKPIPVPIETSDFGTDRLRSHHQITVETINEVQVGKSFQRVRVTQTHLDRYEVRGSIDQYQAEAGRIYYRHAYYAGAVPSPAQSGAERVDGNPTTGGLVRGLSAKESRDRAILVLGSELFRIVEAVCVEDRAAEAWAIEKKEHPRAGIAILRIALTTLAKHYGLIR